VDFVGINKNPSENRQTVYAELALAGSQPPLLVTGKQGRETLCGGQKEGCKCALRTAVVVQDWRQFPASLGHLVSTEDEYLISLIDPKLEAGVSLREAVVTCQVLNSLG
jgi:hypothetical protein